MAELNVVRKKKSPLPWILAALLVLGLLAYFLLRESPATTDVPAAQQDSAMSYDTSRQAAP